MEGEVKFDIEAGRVVGQQMDIDKRILGFAGPTSSMHYIMRMEEKLLKRQKWHADDKVGRLQHAEQRKSTVAERRTSPQSTKRLEAAGQARAQRAAALLATSGTNRSRATARRYDERHSPSCTRA